MTILIILISIYVLSVLGSYKATQLEYYHPEGDKYNRNLSPVEGVTIMLMPCWNTIHALSLITGIWRSPTHYNKTFFKPKKPLT